MIFRFLINAIKLWKWYQIRSQTTRHHVPAKIISVPDIPHTKNGKKMEIAVHQAINGQPIQNTAALANPEALDVFKNIFLQRI